MNSHKRVFGTDGIRGRVGAPPITADVVLKLGWAAGRVLAPGGQGSILIGKDTRISGYMFEAALEAGLSASGVDIKLLGPMPTPAIAYLTQTLHARAGIVISASHNPYFDNGIKFFGPDGMKLPDEVETAIERELDLDMQTVDSRSLGKAVRVVDAAGRYIEFCKSTIPWGTGLERFKIVVDCAHGATYHVAPNVFRELGAEVVSIGASPDGYNINAGCGSTEPAALQAAVREHRADVGVALDGDGDRVIMVDHQAEVLDGDELLYILARDRARRGALNGAVVGTVMTNLGLEEALAREAIELKRAPVGDRYVLEMMKASGALLGGETSGHIICLDRQPTGDGITAALQVLVSLHEQGVSLHEAKQAMSKHPQVLVNVGMPRAFDVMGMPEITAAVRAAEGELGGSGRVLLRPSGTEPLVRVMVEGRDPGAVEALANRLAGQVESILAR